MQRLVLTFLAALMVLIAIGCGSGTDFSQVSGQQGNVSITPPPPPPPDEDSAFLRLAHLSPNAGNVNILVNGTQVGTNVTFEFFSNYLEVEAGPTRVQVRFSGTSTDALDTTVNLAADSHSTVAVIGLQSVDTTNQGTGLQVAVLTDDVVSAANTLRARLFHTVPGAGPLRLATAEGDVLLGPVSFGQATTYAVIDVEELDTDSLNLLNADGEVIEVYTNLRNSQTTLAGALENAAGLAGANTTISAAGDGENSLPLVAALDQPFPLGGTTLVADPVVPDPPPPPPPPGEVNLRVFHGLMVGSEMPEVDVLLNGTVVAAGLEGQGVTDYFVTQAGEVSLQVRVSGSSEDLFEQTVTFEADAHQTLSLVGEVALTLSQLVPSGTPLPPGGLVFSDDVVRVPEMAKFRFTHTSGRLGPVKVQGRLQGSMDPFDLTDVLAPGQSFVSEELDVLSFAGVRELRIVDEADQVLGFFTGAREVTAEMLGAFDSWDPTQGVTATFFLSGQGFLTDELETETDLDLTITGAVNDPTSGGLNIKGDGILPI